MSLTPAEGGWRVVVVDGAEDMNQSAANAILKVLEEPPARALLILCCAAPGRLLPTIRSRCRRLRLDPLDDAPMGELLAAYLPDLPEDERGRLITLAEGSPGRALKLAEAEGLKIAALVDEVLAALPDFSPARAYALADTLLRGESGFSTFMDMLRAGLAAAVREAVRGRADPGAGADRRAAVGGRMGRGVAGAGAAARRDGMAQPRQAPGAGRRVGDAERLILPTRCELCHSCGRLGLVSTAGARPRQRKRSATAGCQ